MRGGGGWVSRPDRGAAHTAEGFPWVGENRGPGSSSGYAAFPPESGVPGSLVERRGPVVLAGAQASKSASRYRGLRPNEWKVGPPPMHASFARVAGAVRKPRSVKRAAACRRSNRLSNSLIGGNLRLFLDREGNIPTSPFNNAKARLNCGRDTFQSSLNLRILVTRRHGLGGRSNPPTRRQAR